MNKRGIALETIRIEFATYGKETQTSMRAYVENRIGWEARCTAVGAGLKMYNARNTTWEEPSNGL